MRLRRYVMRQDTGFAPNFEPPMATLATCAPNIRRDAQPGEIVLAFNGRDLHPTESNSVRWAGVVSKVMTLAGYWNTPDFRTKRPPHYGGNPLDLSSDNIYRPTSKGLEQVQNNWHGPGDAARDIRGRNALAFERYWYFGSTVAILPEEFGLWITARRNAPNCEIGDPKWRELQRWLDDNALPMADALASVAALRARCCSAKNMRLSRSGCGDQSPSPRC